MEQCFLGRSGIRDSARRERCGSAAVRGPSPGGMPEPRACWRDLCGRAVELHLRQAHLDTTLTRPILLRKKDGRRQVVGVTDIGRHSVALVELQQRKLDAVNAPIRQRLSALVELGAMRASCAPLAGSARYSASSWRSRTGRAGGFSPWRPRATYRSMAVRGSSGLTTSASSRAPPCLCAGTSRASTVSRALMHASSRTRGRYRWRFRVSSSRRREHASG